MSRQRVWFAVLATVVLLLPTGAHAQSADEQRRQAEQYEQQADAARERAERLARQTEKVEGRVAQILQKVEKVQARLATARESLDEVERRLAVAGQALEAAELEADKAAAVAERARTRAERADADLAAKQDELQVNEDERGSVARNAYKYGPGVSSPQMAALHMAEGTNPAEIADVIHMLDVVLVDHGMLVDESVRLAEESELLAAQAREAHEERERERAVADDARDAAAARHAEVLVLMGEAEQAVIAQQEAVGALEAQQARAQRQIDQLSRARRQAEGEAARRSDQAREAAERAERLAAEAAAAARQIVPAGVSVSPVSGGLARVGGITVAASIAPQLQALLEAARADGIVLGGYGYRSVETTIRLRRANGCPDVWTSPPSSCRVPTARPGTSMHERGLAIDFTWNGRTICYPNPPSRCFGNAAHDWLRAHAGSYGLHGLSSEAWHFSTNGR